MVEKPFIITTGANDGYRAWLDPFTRSVTRFGYPLEVYDLGGLGFGTPMHQPGLRSDGYYEVVGRGWKSKALHKPTLVEDCVRRLGRFTIYLDADTLVLQPIDEVVGDYDIGVTIRPRSEMAEQPARHREYAGYINAGVLFVAPTPGAMKFLAAWKKLTRTHRNDQKALNLLVNPDARPLEPGAELEGPKGAWRIRTFPGRIYNRNYAIPLDCDETTRIAHFKSKHDRRREFAAEQRAHRELFADEGGGCEAIVAACNARWARRYYWERLRSTVPHAPGDTRTVHARWEKLLAARSALIDRIEASEKQRGGRLDGTSASDRFDRRYWELEVIAPPHKCHVLHAGARDEILGVLMHELHACRVVESATIALPSNRTTFDLVVADLSADVTDAPGAIWGVPQYLAFVQQWLARVRAGGELVVRFEEPPPHEVGALLRKLYGWTQGLLRIRVQLSARRTSRRSSRRSRPAR